MRTFTPKLTESDTIAFAFLAAEQGFTPDKFIESFVNDIVSSFYNEEITEEKHLSDWFNGSWFSKDNDEYFSFLQYIIRNKYYKYISAALMEVTFFSLHACIEQISINPNMLSYWQLTLTIFFAHCLNILYSYLKYSQ